MVSMAFMEEKFPVILFYETDEAPLSFRVISTEPRFAKMLKWYSFKNAKPESLESFAVRDK